MSYIYGFFGMILKWCYELFDNYFIALILFTLLMQIVLLPLAIKQQKNTNRQAALAPKMAAIRKKYAGRNDRATQEKQQKELADLYSKEKFNPASGCLPMLIQFPIIMILYNIVRNPLTYISNLSSGTIESMVSFAKDNLGFTSSGYNEINLVKIINDQGKDVFTGIEGLKDAIIPDFNLFKGFSMASVPKEEHSFWMIGFVILTFLSIYLSQKIIRKFTYQSPETIEAQNNASMKIMNIAMPLMSTYFSYIFPLAVGIYWIIRNILQTVQQIVLAKIMPPPKFSEEDYKAAEKEYLGKSYKKKKSQNNSGQKVRSLHRIDEDDDSPALSNEDQEDDEAEENTDSIEPKIDKTGSGPAPAPIKTDDKNIKYKAKKGK